MVIQNQASAYRIYLLTIWAERGRSPDTPTVWHFSLADPRSGQRHGFANPAALITALHQEIAQIEAAHSKRGEDP